MEAYDKKKLVASSSLNYLQKLLERSRKRTKYRDGPVMDFVEQTKDVVAEYLLTDKITYHESFYAKIVNTAKLKCAKKWFREYIESGQINK